MLTQTLQQLEENKMLLRKSFNTVPPHVEYTLTPLGGTASGSVTPPDLNAICADIAQGTPGLLLTLARKINRA